MKFTLSWLKDHLDTSATVDEISTILTAIGLEVEEVTDQGKALRPFVVAKILQTQKHPQADKLQVCRVQTDGGEQQIVCGAPNARAELKVALAKEGVTIPVGGMVIKKTRIRGVESNGMLCSERELGLGNHHEGIIELPESATIGESIIDVLGLNDPLIDIAVTPNRGDALGVRGIARDLAAAGLGTLKPFIIEEIKSDLNSPTKVNIMDGEACPLFVGITIKGLKNNDSPEWMQRRLKAIGLRPISALVDITNYITVDLGRPLHVYDAHKLKGNITVRPAKDGEELLALNDKEYVLADGMTAIADDSGVIGLGGIIGGVSTGVTQTTTEVFLEAALFNPTHIARTGRVLGIDSDARYRFERGADPAFVRSGAAFAAQLIVKLCGGESSKPVIAGAEPHWKRSVTLHEHRVETLGGLKLEAQHQKAILEKLGFTLIQDSHDWDVSPPSWRGDVEREADLVEEILRIHGYDHIPSTPLPKPEGITKPSLNTLQKRIFTIKRALAARGFLETVTWSFLAEREARLFDANDLALRIINPISADLNTMRPGLLPNLLMAAAKNITRGFSDLALAEVGPQFSDITPAGQILMACGIRIGSNAPKNIYKDKRLVEVSDVKQDVWALLTTLGLNPNKLQIIAEASGSYHPGRSGTLMLGKTIIAHFGELHPSVLQQMDIKTNAAGFEIFLQNFPETKAKSKVKPPLHVSDFQAVERDFAFLIDDAIPAQTLLNEVKKSHKNLITNVALFDVYTGKGINPGKKSLAITVTLQSMDHTLTEAEIEAVSQSIIQAAEALGAQLRIE